MGSKLCTIVSLDRSPSQSADEFGNFLNKLNLTMKSITQKNLLLLAILMPGHQNGGQMIR